MQIGHSGATYMHTCTHLIWGFKGLDADWALWRLPSNPAERGGL